MGRETNEIIMYPDTCKFSALQGEDMNQGVLLSIGRGVSLETWSLSPMNL